MTKTWEKLDRLETMSPVAGLNSDAGSREHVAPATALSNSRGVFFASTRPEDSAKAIKSLLLVDDDALIMRCYGERLSHQGFNVNTAHSALAAIDVLRNTRIDLVILDLMMPNISGVEVLKFIRSHPKIAALPVIVLTNAFMSDLAQEAVNLGIERALLKAECSPSILIRALDEAFERQTSENNSPQLPRASTPPGETGPAKPTPSVPKIQVTAPRMVRQAPLHALPAPQTVSPAPQAIPVSSSPSRPPEQTTSALDESDAKATPGEHLLTHVPGICSDLRKLLQAFLGEQGSAKARELRLQDLYRKVHFLAASAGLTEHARVAQTAAVFEALLFVLMENPARINPSVLRTITKLVDCVELLGQHSGKFAGPLPSTRVLVVDDDKLSNRLVVSSLRQVSLQARSIEDPLVALQRLEAEHYDLILLDIQMPGLNGFEVCKRLRALPRYEKTPVIYVTAHSDFENRAKSLLSGGQDLIGKPILPMELAAKVVMLLLMRQVESASTT